MIPSSAFSPNNVMGAQFIKASTTNNKMYNISATQHQAAKGAPSSQRPIVKFHQHSQAPFAPIFFCQK